MGKITALENKVIKMQSDSYPKQEKQIIKRPKLKPQELQTAINTKIMLGGDVTLAAALKSTRQEKSPEVTLKSPREVR